MRAQISRAILGVAVLLVIGLGLPLGVAVERFYQDRATVDLQRRAAETIVEIALPLDAVELAQVATEPDTPGPFAVYDPSGRLFAGDGPPLADAAVRAALGGQAQFDSDDQVLALASPITDRSAEAVVGAVVVTEPSSVVDGQVHRAWLLMAAVVMVALAGAAALARVQSRQLAAPVARLAEHAVDLGRGEFGARVESSGIAEVDTVADALNDTAGRLAELLARERSFSSDVSHQLRTPLTGLRLSLERAVAEPGQPGDLMGALDEVARLEATVEHLLALSRDRLPVGAPLATRAMLAAVERRWRGPFDAAGRGLRVDAAGRVAAVRGSDVSIGQVLDVLIGNGLQHGGGVVTVRSRAAAGGLVLEVTDEGQGISDDRRQRVFERHEGSGNGIGLSLARSLAEAEGGRLLLGTGQPPCFQIVLPAAE